MHYVIQPVNLSAHLYLVMCEIYEPDLAGQFFSLPTWIPGSYMVREFAKNIVTMSASCGGVTVELVKVDKSTWRAAPCAGPLLLRYEVYAWDLSVRTAHLDMTHGFFNGSSVFVAVHGKENHAMTVDILPPALGAEGWRVATSMRLAGAELYGFGRYGADNYDELIDHPVEMGTFVLATFEVAGVPHDIAVTGRHKTDLARLSADLKVICETEVAFFGGLPEIGRYLFLVMVVGDGYGGLEHRASCSLLCSRHDLPVLGKAEQSEAYRGFLGLCSHEYFHTWNVKQIKPAAFMPYDLSKEVYTRQLWAFEGITSYYDDLILLRSGLIDSGAYLQLLAQGMSRVWMGAGRFKQSVAESSFDAWTKFYRQDENSVNAIVSYYAKGSVIALALDLTIRKVTQNSRSLDDVMVRLWREYGQAGVGLMEGEVERIAAEVAGVPLDDFFNRYLYGTDDQPIEELLALVGVGFSLRAALSPDDKGGRAVGKGRLSPRLVLGAKGAADPLGVKLATIFSGGAAEGAGLAAGDVIVSLYQIRVTNSNLEVMLEQYKEGVRVVVHAFRRDELLCFELCLQAAPMDRVELSLLEGVDAGTRAWRTSWMSGS